MNKDLNDDILEEFNQFMAEDFFQTDQEINDYLQDNIFEKHDEKQIKLVCEEIALKYKGHSFLKDSKYFSVDLDVPQVQIQENENYKQIYEDARKDEKYTVIFEKMKVQDFNIQNNIPSLFIEKKTSISKLNNQLIKLIFDLNEYRQNLRDLSQVELIKIMMIFINENVQDEILSLIGSLFNKQREHFENYLSWIKKQDQKQYQEFVNKLQDFQQGICDLQNHFQSQEINFLADLLSLKLVNDKQNVTQFITKSINVKQDQYKDQLQYFESANCCKENLDQIYFVLIFFFWIKYSNELVKFRDSLDQALKKASDKKKTFEAKVKMQFKNMNLDDINLFLKDKIIYFLDANKLYEVKSDENLSQQIFSKFSINANDKQNEISDRDVDENQFLQYWKYLQTLQFYQIQFIADNSASKQFQSILFTNKLELSTQVSLELGERSKFLYKVYQSLPKNEVEFEKFIEELEKYNQKFDQPMLIMDILKLVSDYNENLIFNVSTLLIWKLVGRKQWNNLKTLIALDQDKQREFNKFESQIVRNELKAIKENAKELLQKFKNDFEEDYYNNEQLFDQQFKQLPSEKDSETSKDYILKLDNKFQYIEQLAQEEQQNLIEYIKNQYKFIDKSVKDEITKIKNMHIKSLNDDYQEKFIYYFKQIFYRAKKFYDETKQFISDDLRYIYNKNYIENYDEKQLNQSKYNQYFNLPILEILICYLLGQNTKQLDKFEDIDEQYSNLLKNDELDDQNQQRVKFYKGKYQMEIFNLQSFVKEFLTNLQSDLQKPPNISESNQLFQSRYKPIQTRLDQISIKKIGCPQVCPNCNRKCDSEDFTNPNHFHLVQSGHQYNGFQKILINNYPSLFTCEQMQDLHIQKINDKYKTWKELKEKDYWNWKFGCEVLEKRLQTQQNYWFNGLGKIFCKDLSISLKKTINFIEKDKMPKQELDFAKNYFYIFMLDDSGSMQGEKWNNLIKGVKATLDNLEKNPLAKVSVIVFNTESRLVIENKKADSNDIQEITFKGGSTEFEYPFLMAFDQITKHGYNNEQIVLMFYTDGDARYPQDAMDKYQNLDSNLKKVCKVNILSEENSDTIQQMAQTLQQQQYETTLRANVQASQIEQQICETVCKN